MELPQRLFGRVAYRIDTPRLCLRCYEPADAPAVQAAVIANADHLEPWMAWAGLPPTLDEELRRLGAFRAGFDLGLELVYGLFDREHGQLLGSAGLHPRSGPEGLELGYWIDQGHEGRGLVTEAAAALSRVGLELMGAQWIEVRHDPANERSARVPERLGFTREGLLRSRLSFRGERRDQVVWSLLAAELGSSPVRHAELTAYDALGRPLT